MRIVALLLALSTGCSWMSSRPVRHYSNGSVDCSSGKAAPTVDVLMATAFGIGGLAAATESGAAALIPLGIATAYTISASHGFKQAGECREAIDELAMQEEEESDSPHWVAPSDKPNPDASANNESVDDEPADVAPAVTQAKTDVEIDASELEP